MLPDNFPVFQIDLDCDFESSDNVYPSLNKASKKPIVATEATTIVQNETSAIFSTIGERRDNLDRVRFYLSSALWPKRLTLLSWLSLMVIVTHNLLITFITNSLVNLEGIHK